MSNFEHFYYNPPHPAAYASVEKLSRASKKKKQHVSDWLEWQDSYNLHKPVRRKFPRRFYNVRNIDDWWEVDLIDVRSIKTYNDGYSYILAVIDVLSKYAWLEPLIDKSGVNVAKAFEAILDRSGGRVPICLQSDMGKEFLSRHTQRILKKNEIRYRVVRCPDTKAAIVERFIRTIKERLWRYFTHKRTRRFVEILPNIVESYNNSRHSATKMVPAAVNRHNAAEARQNLESKYNTAAARKVKYRIGDLVRISRGRRVFAKGYEGGWTLELFRISRISTSRQPILYYLKDLAGEDIDGYFYEAELSRVRKDLESEVFEVDQVLAEKGKGLRKKYLVSWKGYPAKFNSWINAAGLRGLQ